VRPADYLNSGDSPATSKPFTDYLRLNVEALRLRPIEESSIDGGILIEA
jgi:hypothetical protein